MDRLTFGLELEWADVDKRTPLDKSLATWDWRDYTIVNSDGHANDPTGKTWNFGGEINTVPTRTPQEQAEIVRQLAAQLHPTINYRCNLHVHVGVVGLRDDVAELKRVAQYFRAAEPFVYAKVEPIPKPQRQQYPSDDAFKGAMKRYRRRLVSHHQSMPPARFAEMMAAQTSQEFYEAHAPATKAGRRAWHLAPRAGMNLRSLWKHGTIEFRHFPGTADADEIESAVSWAALFTQAALDGTATPQDLYASRAWKFPIFRRYRHDLETEYQRTKFKGKL